MLNRKTHTLLLDRVTGDARNRKRQWKGGILSKLLVATVVCGRFENAVCYIELLV